MNLTKIYQLSGAELLAISWTFVSLTSSVKAQTDVEPNIAVVEKDNDFDRDLDNPQSYQQEE